MHWDLIQDERGWRIYCKLCDKVIAIGEGEITSETANDIWTGHHYLNTIPCVNHSRIDSLAANTYQSVKP